MDSQLAQYIPVLFLLLVALAIAGGILILSEVAGRFFNRKIAARTTQMKDTPYECGMLPIGGGSSRFSVKFYLVAMIFILFDIEVDPGFDRRLDPGAHPRLDGILRRHPLRRLPLRAEEGRVGLEKLS